MVCSDLGPVPKPVLDDEMVLKAYTYYLGTIEFLTRTEPKTLPNNVAAKLGALPNLRAKITKAYKGHFGVSPQPQVKRRPGGKAPYSVAYTVVRKKLPSGFTGLIKADSTAFYQLVFADILVYTPDPCANSKPTANNPNLGSYLLAEQYRNRVLTETKLRRILINKDRQYQTALDQAAGSAKIAAEKGQRDGWRSSYNPPITNYKIDPKVLPDLPRCSQDLRRFAATPVRVLQPCR